MVMLREELPGKVDDPAPKLYTMSICAVVEKEDACLSRQRKRESCCRCSARAATTAGNRWGATTIFQGRRAIDGAAMLSWSRRAEDLALIPCKTFGKRCLNQAHMCVYILDIDNKLQG
jgi:hypothetical protein